MAFTTNCIITVAAFSIFGNYWMIQDRDILADTSKAATRVAEKAAATQAKLEQERDNLKQQNRELKTEIDRLKGDKYQCDIDLAAKTGTLTENDRRLKANDEYVAELRDNNCGSFLLTPKGALDQLEEWVKPGSENWWTLIPFSMLGNMVFCAILSGVWRMFVYPRGASSRRFSHSYSNVLAVEDAKEAIRVPIQEEWLVFWIRRVVGWFIAFVAFTYLPPLVSNFIGNTAQDQARATQDEFCQRLPQLMRGGCNLAYDVAAMNADMVARGEAYVWLFRGWQRVAFAQTVSWAGDQVLVLAICLVFWPITGRFDYVFALPSRQSTEALEDIQTRKITFRPGMIGLRYQPNSGAVESVNAGQGKDAGVQVGWRILAINGAAYTDELWEQYKNGSAEYDITFELPQDNNNADKEDGENAEKDKENETPKQRMRSWINAL